MVDGFFAEAGIRGKGRIGPPGLEAPAEAGCGSLVSTSTTKGWYRIETGVGRTWVPAREGVGISTFDGGGLGCTLAALRTALLLLSASSLPQARTSWDSVSHCFVRNRTDSVPLPESAQPSFKLQWADGGERGKLGQSIEISATTSRYPPPMLPVLPWCFPRRNMRSPFWSFLYKLI